MFCDAHPDRQVVVYANTSGGEGARRLDGHQLVRAGHRRALASSGAKNSVGARQASGRYIQQTTGADMLLWDAACIVHDEFKGLELELLRKDHPDAMILVHPESPEAVVRQADVVGSTSQLLKAVVDGKANEYIVATDKGMFHRMQQLAPGKTLIEAPTAGDSATCKSCAHCPWMAMNGLEGASPACSTASARSTC
jgi:quinolinate synthase